MRGAVVAAQWQTDTVLTLSRVVLAAVHGSLGLPGWRLSRGFTLLAFSHSSPSLIGLLALSNKVSQSLWLVPGPFKTLSVCHFLQLAPVIVHAVRVSKCRTGTARGAMSSSCCDSSLLLCVCWYENFQCVLFVLSVCFSVCVLRLRLLPVTAVEVHARARVLFVCLCT